MKSNIEKITEERDKQIEKGYTPVSDQRWQNKELLYAALAYLNTALYGISVGSEDWPFAMDLFNPGDREENLIKAAALIVAELDRINVN